MVIYSQKVNWIFDVLLLRDGLSAFVWWWWILFKHEYNKISCCKYIIHNANCDLTIDQKLIWKQFQVLQIHSALLTINSKIKYKIIFQFSLAVVHIFVMVEYVKVSLLRRWYYISHFYSIHDNHSVGDLKEWIDLDICIKARTASLYNNTINDVINNAHIIIAMKGKHCCQVMHSTNK